MQSFSNALNPLHDDGSWFVRAQELRLWLLRCDASLTKPVRTLVPKFEFHADNFDAWPVLVDAYTHADDGWQLRANGLAADWTRRVEAFSRAEIRQGPVAAVEHPRGIEAFRATATAVLQAMVERLAGLVIVLAPTILDDDAGFQADLTALVHDPALQRCRWVVLLDADATAPRDLIAALGPERWMETTCCIDEAEQHQDLSAMLASPDPARFGLTWPVGVDPPRRINEPTAGSTQARDAALRAEGINPELLEVGPQIRIQAISAALAMKEGRGADTIAAQREVVRLCAGLGMVDLQVITQTALAAYLSGLGQRPAAKQELHQAIELAREHGLQRVQSQALLALALLYNLDDDTSEAIQAYVGAARVAEAGEEPSLAIEAWRMAGQLAMDGGQDQPAVDCFNEALRIATEAEPAIAKLSSASEAARSLAGMYARHGMQSHALSLYERADAFERAEEVHNASE